MSGVLATGGLGGHSERAIRGLFIWRSSRSIDGVERWRAKRSGRLREGWSSLFMYACFYGCLLNELKMELKVN